MMKHLLLLLSFLFLPPSAQAVTADFDRGEAEIMLKHIYGAKVPDVDPGIVTEEIVQPKEWTVMAFVNGKNNLEKFALKDINEMEAAGSTASINIVVELGRTRDLTGAFRGNDYWEGTRRYFIEKNDDFNVISSPVLNDMQKTDMGDYKSVADFVKWAKTQYPANHYMLIIWNHGMGWFKADKVAAKGISYDEETRNHIKPEQLGLIFEEAGPVDLLVLDSCLMQTLSVNYELKNHVSYLIASEETEPADGYDYGVFLRKVSDGPKAPEDLAKYLIDSYGEFYTEQEIGVTQSVINLPQINDFTGIVNQWAETVMEHAKKEDVVKAKDGALHFDNEDNKDLYDFIEILNSVTESEEVKQSGTAVQKYITGNLVYYNRTVDFERYIADGSLEMTQYSKAKGIAAYIPSSFYNESYNSLKWAKETKWPDLIKWYLDEK